MEERTATTNRDAETLRIVLYSGLERRIQGMEGIPLHARKKTKKGNGVESVEYCHVAACWERFTVQVADVTDLEVGRIDGNRGKLGTGGKVFSTQKKVRSEILGFTSGGPSPEHETLILTSSKKFV